MEVKPPGQNSWLPNVADLVWHRRRWRILAILLYTLIVFVLGALIFRAGIHVELANKFLDNADAIPELPGNVLRGLQAEPERMTIDIQHEDFMRLAYQREIALANGYLVTGDADYVPANVSHNGKSDRVRIRLKGDFLDHLNTDKWSYRIKVRGDNTVFGMKEFSIQHPKTRNYVYEWIYHQALRREGVISLRYEFVDVTLNGKHLGIYALEEHFDKLLIEDNELREGPIIRFNENLLFAERFQQLHKYPDAKVNGNSTFQAADIDSFQTNRILSDPILFEQQEGAIQLLESFRQGKLPTSAVFDVPKLARFFAINDLLGAHHSENWQNLRFYYNPITSRLEPIGFDGDSGQSIRAVSPRLGPEVGPEFIGAVFDDHLFFEEYVRTLEHVSQPSYLNSLLADLDEELRQNLNIIYRDYPYFSFSTDVFFRNQRYIETVLNPIKGLHAYFRKVNENHLELELGNIQWLPIEVLGVSYGDSKQSLLDEPLVLLPSELQNTPVDYRVVQFALPLDIQWSDVMLNDLEVNYRLMGSDLIRHESVFPWSSLSDAFTEEDLVRREANPHTFDFLTIDEAGREIVFKTGSWVLDRSLIVPQGYSLKAGPGTQIDLIDSATILSYSALEFTGTEEWPVIIQSTDGTGQGIVVLSAAESSLLQFVTFSNLASPARSGWQLTGAVTFYESPVQISNSRFDGNRSEDALNIVRSKFQVDHSTFAQASFDAIDVDFGQGIVSNSTFISIGNDAIDTSGSEVVIEDIAINGSGDKGISVGEISSVSITNATIKDTLIAVAVKDMSAVEAQQIEIENSEVGLAIYQKKSEFGAARLEVLGLEILDDVISHFLVERQSELYLDGKAIEAYHENVYDMIYGR